MVAPAQSIASPVYNVPAKLLDRYRGRDVIVRSSSPRELAECLRDAELTSVRFMQLSSTPEDTSCLESFGPGIPLDIVLENPAQYQQLYSYSNLLDSHPVRITIPLVSGFSQAVKLAISLRYAVKLDVQQPDEDLLTELEDVLDLYLHLSSVNQPNRDANGMAIEQIGITVELLILRGVFENDVERYAWTKVFETTRVFQS
jgi:hypothetical protein